VRCGGQPGQGEIEFNVPVKVACTTGQQGQEQGTLKMPMAVDYWAGDDSLPRRLTVVMDVGGQAQTTEATFSDWGKPLAIVAPPAAQVGPRPGM
jgi:hypothetical protein